MNSLINQQNEISLFEELKITDSLFLQLSREGINYPISESQVEEGEGVCLD